MVGSRGYRGTGGGEGGPESVLCRDVRAGMLKRVRFARRRDGVFASWDRLILGEGGGAAKNHVEER